MSTETLFETTAASQGWTPATQVSVLLNYIANQKSHAAFADFLAEQAAEENAYNAPQEMNEWSGSPDPSDPDNHWIDDVTGERVCAATGIRTQRQPSLVEIGAAADDGAPAPPARSPAKSLFYIVTGRRHGADEDCCHIVSAESRAAAMSDFKVYLLEDDFVEDASPFEEKGDFSRTVYINTVLECDSEPRDAR